MKNEDIQITYVITEKAYQGKGLAYDGLKTALNSLSIRGDVWYVTDSNNFASQKLAEKLGFRFEGYGKRKVKLFGMLKKLELKKYD